MAPLVWIFTFGMLCQLLACSAQATDYEISTHGQYVEVVSVVDGDTVELDVDGETHTARLLGIDTPETKHPNRHIECFGQEATDALTWLLDPPTQVWVEFDVETRDYFGRLLVHLFIPESALHVNAEMVRYGYADVLIISPNNDHSESLRAALTEAKSKSAGLWSQCESAHSALPPPRTEDPNAVVVQLPS